MGMDVRYNLVSHFVFHIILQLAWDYVKQLKGNPMAESNIPVLWLKTNYTEHLMQFAKRLFVEEEQFESFLHTVVSKVDQEAIDKADTESACHQILEQTAWNIRFNQMKTIYSENVDEIVGEFNLQTNDHSDLIKKIWDIIEKKSPICWLDEVNENTIRIEINKSRARKRLSEQMKTEDKTNEYEWE
jgi:hypothetical protein